MNPENKLRCSVKFYSSSSLQAEQQVKKAVHRNIKPKYKLSKKKKNHNETQINRINTDHQITLKQHKDTESNKINLIFKFKLQTKILTSK